MALRYAECHRCLTGRMETRPPPLPLPLIRSRDREPLAPVPHRPLPLGMVQRPTPPGRGSWWNPNQRGSQNSPFPRMPFLLAHPNLRP